MNLEQAKAALISKDRVIFKGRTLSNLQSESTEYECIEALVFKNIKGKIVPSVVLKDLKANSVLSCGLEDVDVV